ncbi:MAG: electron transfer flavoprotein subunit beta/FixA family protein, partial [Actinomycetes bacterium]
MTLRVAILVKQIPAFDELRLDERGRLDRSGPLEMNPYCRRAVAGGVELVAAHGGSLTVVTLGPPSAEDVLREAIAWATDRGVAARGLLVTDPEFAGSDTFATARALAAAIRRIGPVDLLVAGRTTIDGETGQVPPQLAELLDLPLLTGVRHWDLDRRRLEATCEHDEGTVRARVRLPALVTTAERLTDPCKVDAPRRAGVPADRIDRIDATALGRGPWGAAGSPTWVGPARAVPVTRSGDRHPERSITEQVDHAVSVLRARRALDPAPPFLDTPTAIGPISLEGPIVAVIAEPGRDPASRSLVALAARLAQRIDGHAAAISFERESHGIGRGWARWGAGRSVEVSNATAEEDAAAAITAWAVEARPWGILAASTTWGREVAARVAAAHRGV